MENALTVSTTGHMDILWHNNSTLRCKKGSEWEQKQRTYKLCYIHKMEYYTVIKKNVWLSHTRSSNLKT